VITDAYDTYGNSPVTFWVGVLDEAGNYDAAPPSVTGSIGSGFSLDTVPEGTTYNRTLASAIANGVPKKSEMHLFPSAVLDTDGVRIDVNNPGG